VDKFSGYKAILSGPAGGVVGYARTTYDGNLPVIGFDMGKSPIVATKGFFLIVFGCRRNFN
jgi:hypothetical protein